MRRILIVALAALAMGLGTSQATAQSCAGGNCGFGSGGPIAGWNNGFFGISPFGCGFFCMKLFGATHQDGPLFNYGPYYGYYPFEPYGPWTSDLRYTGPTAPFNPAGCGWNFGRHGGCGLGLGGGLFNRERGCNTCGGYALSTFRNVFTRLHPFSWRGNLSQSFGCGSCSAVGVSAAPIGGCMTER
jgi:hypothetical protein